MAAALVSSLARAFGDVLRKDFDKELTEEKKKQKKAKKQKKEEKKEEKRPKKDVDERQVLREGQNSLITYPNASAFSVFSHVRHFVLQNQLCDTFNSRLGPSQGEDSDSEEEGEDKEAAKKDDSKKIPAVVGLGVKGVFVIIRDIWRTHPELCLRALTEFSNILSGQTPAGLKNEPADTTGALYELLMDMVTESFSPEDRVGIELSSQASACLLSLVVALGDTGKMLAALAAMLTAPPPLANVKVKIPQIFYNLQTSVQAVLLGTVVETDWLTQGIPSKSKIESWPLPLPSGDRPDSDPVVPCLTGDGKYLYVHGAFGLMKVGTGYKNTIRGKVYQSAPDFYPQASGWLGYSSNQLYFFPLGQGEDAVTVLSPETLAVENKLEFEADSIGPMCLFTNEEGLGQILAKKEGGYALRMFTTLCSPLACVSEKQLQLSQKSLLGMGRTKYDPQDSQHTIYQDNAEQVVRVLAAKNFAAVQTASGKLLYSGNGAVFGVTGKDVPRGEWKELELPDKNVKVEQCSCDNSGAFCLVISDRGVAYFGGVSRKGESGEPVARREQNMKPTKLKRIGKLKDQHIVSGACGSHATCLIAKDGGVFMFGDLDGDILADTGAVTDLLGVPASQVALGRSHTCILTQMGVIYTFGSNQFGQCGVNYVPPVHAFEEGDDSYCNEDNSGSSDDEVDMCAPGDHKWSHNVCMICKSCGYCTGYGPGCCNQGLPDRNPGKECGCGAGDSGCKECGCCRVCAGDRDKWDGMFAMEGDEADMFSALKDKLKKRKDKPKKKERKEPNMGLQLLFGGEPSLERENSTVSSQVSVEQEQAEAPEAGSTKKPVIVPLPDDLTAMQVDCGTFHTVVLLHSGEVYAFGNGNHGQLGQGNNKICGHPVKVPLPHAATQIACGDNHTVVLLETGQVCTFGKHQEGQLGRSKQEGDDDTWHMTPRIVDNMVDNLGMCKATWVGAKGNQTFISVDEMLISERSLSRCKTFSTSQALGVVPPSEESARRTNFIMIENGDLKPKKFDDEAQADLSGCGVYVDSEYNVLWGYSAKENKMTCYNPIANNMEDSSGTILSTSICLPQSKEAETDRSHMAVNLLSCLSTLATHPPLTVEKLTGSGLQKVDKDSFNCVVRYNAHGGGWGYSASSVEAIRFSPDADVLLGGFGLYGGRGTYNAEIKVFDIGTGGGDAEIEGTLMTSQLENGYSCEKQQTYRIFFDKPVMLFAEHWYVVRASVSSPGGTSSDAGSSGQASVQGPDRVTFKIKSSKRSNNGTDVGSGQIPEILYRIPEVEKETGFQIQLLDRSFSSSVSADGLNAVLRLLEWAWRMLTEQGDASAHDCRYLAFVARSSLHLLQTYIQEAYPKQLRPGKKSQDCAELAEAVYQAQTILRHILSSRRHASLTSPLRQAAGGTVEPSVMELVLESCCAVFRSCFHAFYPTTPLKWWALCQHLQLLDPNDVIAGAPMENLLSAILEALAEPPVSYIGLGYDKTIGIREALYNSEPDPLFPILSEYMQSKTLEENADGQLLGFNIVATKLLGIVTAPVQSVLSSKIPQVLESPVVSKAGKLLQSRINELALCITYPESAILSGLPIFKSEKREKVLESSVRFSTKEAGHPTLAVTDVAFSVSKAINMHGVTVYGGVEQSYAYKVTILRGSKVMSLNEGKFTQGEYYGDGYVNIVFKNTVKLEAELVYTARVEMQGSSFCVGVDGSTSFTGPGDVAFTLHHTASKESAPDTGPITKFLYSLSAMSGPQNVVQMSVHLSSTLLEVTIGFLQHILNEDLSLEILNLLGSSFLFSTLLPTTLAQLGPVACKQPKFSVEILDLVKRTLPVASAAAQFAGQMVQPASDSPAPSSPAYSDTNLMHYATVETEHPYKQAMVHHFKVKFSEQVQWMTLEFDPRTGFAQKDDKIGELLIPHRTSHTPSDYSHPLASAKQANGPEVSELIGIGLDDLYADWERYSLESPHGLVMLPGNEVHLVVNVDTEYEKKDSANHFGLKCQVVGYEWTDRPSDCLLFLEKELTTLGSMCAASLLSEDTVLPFAEELTVSGEEVEKSDMRIVQAAAEEVLTNHGPVLSRGLMVETPNIHQILGGHISLITESSEQRFLHDFIESKVDTAGGRLARWLQPDRAVDPEASELVMPEEPVKTGVPSNFVIRTKDQDSKLVFVDGMKVEVKAVWLGNKGSGVTSSSRVKAVDSVMGVRKPTFKRSYNPTRLNSNYLFHSVSMMMAYSDYSFEELRLYAPKVERSSESMSLKSNGDGTYVASWVPSEGGSYLIQIFIDSCNTGKEHTLEVMEVEPEAEEAKEEPDAEEQEAIEDEMSVDSNVTVEQPKMKIFHGQGAPGLRMRAAPSLKAEQLGIIKPGDIFAYSEEVENESGKWVKLTGEAMTQLGCPEGATTAYALAYSKDRDQEFLQEKEPSADFVDQMRKQRPSARKDRLTPAKRKGGSGTYHVIQCGSAGHNIRSKPGIKGTPVGRLAKGNKIEASMEVENDDGIWLRLSPESVTKYCDSDTEAWTLAVGLSGRMFLAAEGDNSYKSQLADTAAAAEAKKVSAFPTAASVFGTPQQPVFTSAVPPMFQFGASTPVKLNFGSQDSDQTSSSSTSSPFKFGSSSSSLSEGDKVKESEAAKPRKTSEKAGSGPSKPRAHSRVLRRRRRSQSPVDEVKEEEAKEEAKEEQAAEKKAEEEKGSDEPSLETKEEEQKPPELIKSVPGVKQALSPAVAECQRAIFAAFLWQENLVSDAIASATFLKFCPELTKELRSQDPASKEPLDSTSKEPEKPPADGDEGTSPDDKPSDEKDETAAEVSAASEEVPEKKAVSKDASEAAERSKPLPPTLSHLVTFWDEISGKVTDSSSLPFPAPKVPKLAQELQDRYDHEKKEIEKRKKDKDKKAPTPAGGGSTVCELCDQSYPDPVTYHMKDIHPGCGKHANGWGYNSRGTFCSGWAGNCGDGGRGGSTWYLLCKDCHSRYMAMKDDAKKKIVKSIPLPKAKTRKPGKPRSLPVVSAIQGMIQNAKFLLEIARPSDSAPPTPQQKSPSVSELSAAGGSDLLRQSSTPLVENIPSSLIEKHDSLPHDVVPDSANTSSESTLTDPSKRPLFLRSVSEAVKPSDQPQRHSVESSDDGSSVFRQPEDTGTPSDHISSSLMLKPSRNLRQLIYKRSRSTPDNKDMGYRKVMAFVASYHDLDGLRVSMKQSMRVAGVRAFAMEFLEWLLNKVREPSIIHDILWQFNCALASHPVQQLAAKVKAVKEKEENEQKNDKAMDVEDYFLSKHPLSRLDGAGIMLQMLRRQFHSFLRTTANLMPKLPVGSAVQQEAMQCYYLQFQAHDHSFLLQSNVFSNISKALSFPEEVSQEGQERRNLRDREVVACMMEDILSRGKLKVSSNDAMSNSLTDKSTETFWESRDEPRAKGKQITVSFDKTFPVFGVAVHVDNQKDAGQRVEKLSLSIGRDEDNLKEVAKVTLSVMHTGWKTLVVPVNSEPCSVVRVEVHGQQNKVRVRQVQVLAPPTKILDSTYPATVAQQRACEAEALRVFRSLTSQVFGGLLSAKPEESIDETDSAPPAEAGDKEGKEGDVREHMVGILFSKGNISGLQKQVCVHVIDSVHTEMVRMKEEWEAAFNKPPTPPKAAKQVSVQEPSSSDSSERQDSDSYCFELLSMLLGLSQSEVGCGFLSEQDKLVHDLFTLLHVASLRIQLQVCSLLRRILPVIGPKNLAPMINVRILPPLGYSAIAEAVNSAATINQLGLLDCLLAIISKALSVQVKAKGRSSNLLQVLTGASNITALTLSSLVNPKLVPGETTVKAQRWYLRGTVPKEVASEVVKLLKDMIQGSLGPQWEGYAKSAIGQAVLHLTKISEDARMPVPGMFSQTLWLCLAALCVIDKEHAEALSSGQWLGQDGKPKSKPLCDNHDDGETEALILCDHCGNLCGECDRVLHYNKKRKDHQRQIFKEEEEAVKVELHEGCGRIKLYWTMALADYRTLKGMIEFKESGSGGGKGACRFCGTNSNTVLHPIGYVCSDAECIGRSEEVCDKTFPCGHACNGVKGEEECLPCLYGCESSKLKQDADDMCMICYTEGLSCAPCVQLECGHVFHYHCCYSALTKRWSGPRITFRFMFCSICVNTPIGHPKLAEVLGPVNDLYADVKRKSLMRLEYENLMKCEAITSPSSKFYQKPLDYAMWKYAYYVCHKCKKSYCGGEANCAEQISASDDYDPTELVCPACAHVGGAVQVCPKHGTDFLEYKCRYCCSVAVYFCFGTTHFCNPCHDDFQRLTSIVKSELPQCPVGACAKPLEGTECPLHVKHPPTGEEFALGCGVCRNAQTF